MRPTRHAGAAGRQHGSREHAQHHCARGLTDERTHTECLGHPKRRDHRTQSHEQRPDRRRANSDGQGRPSRRSEHTDGPCGDEPNQAGKSHGRTPR